MLDGLTWPLGPFRRAARPGRNLSPKVISTFRLRFTGIKFRLNIGHFKKRFRTVKGFFVFGNQTDPSPPLQKYEI